MGLFRGYYSTWPGEMPDRPAPGTIGEELRKIQEELEPAGETALVRAAVDRPIGKNHGEGVASFPVLVYDINTIF